jgi:hypothetical protein
MLMETRKPAAITQLSYFLPKYKECQGKFIKSPTRIKIAILDSGVDRGLFTGLDHSVIGASFVHEHGGSKESPWWLASDLHGSHIANIISQIDPCCDFYIAKVTETKKYLDPYRVVQVSATPQFLSFLSTLYCPVLRFLSF